MDALQARLVVLGVVAWLATETAMAQTAELFQYELADTPGRARLTVDARLPSPHPVNPRLYGKFCEHLGANIAHGMEAQILFNPTFGGWRFSAGDDHPDGGVREETDRERITRRTQGWAGWLGWPDAAPVLDAYFNGGAYGWFRVGPPGAVRLSPDVGPHGGRAQRVEVVQASDTLPYGLGQWIYLPLHRTRGFQFRMVARAVEPMAIRLSIAPVQGTGGAAHADLQLGREWGTFTGRLELPADVPPDALYQFAVTTDAPAHCVLDRVLLYPDDHVGGADPDVVRLLREAGLPLLRWPGGNFASGYHWRAGVGPVDARPTVPNPAWDGLEFNLFGTDEFIAFCRAVGCEPLICVNAGDGTPEEAAAWVEYCNGSPDTPMGRLRAENGHPEPYGVRYWEIGNELYGRWQIGWTTPTGYLDRYLRFREAMVAADPSITLLGCGHGNEPDSEWNHRLIEGAGPALSCITDHILTGGWVDAETEPAELYQAFLGYATELERRYAALRTRMLAAGIRNPRLAITEMQLFASFQGEARPEGRLSPATLPRPDTIAEALYLATVVNTCIRLGDFVELLTHSATVNHGGGLRKERERVYANPVHYAHVLGGALAGGIPVAVRLACSAFSTRRAFGHIPPLANIPVLDAMAVLTPDGKLVVMLIHRGVAGEPIELDLRLEGFRAQQEAEQVTLAGESAHDRNTPGATDRITPRQAEIKVVDEGRLMLTVVPFSLTLITFRPAAEG